MADSGQWARFIRQDRINRLARIQRNLFVNVAETLAYLEGLVDVAQTTPRPPRLPELLAQVRATFMGLPIARAEEYLQALCGTRTEVNLGVVIFGSTRDDTNTSRAAMSRLLDLIEHETSVLGNKSGSSSAMLVLSWLLEASAVGATFTWTNCVQEMHAKSDVQLLSRLVEIIGLLGSPFRLEAVPLSRWRGVRGVITLDGDVLTLDVPTPDGLETWLQHQLRLCTQLLVDRNRGIHRLAEDLRDRLSVFNAAYQDMWLDMMIQPQWSLRDGGLDCATVLVPEMRECGYQALRLTPLDPFPHFRASFLRKRLCSAGTQLIEMDLEPTNLLTVGQSQPAYPLLQCVDQLLAFPAVRAAWTIVMGALAKSKGVSGGHGGGGGDGVVRARFRHLPLGQHASEEARARALAKFRVQPLPGFTFVREYDRGAQPQSGDPLFSITGIVP